MGKSKLQKNKSLIIILIFIVLASFASKAVFSSIGRSNNKDMTKSMEISKIVTNNSIIEPTTALYKWYCLWLLNTTQKFRGAKKRWDFCVFKWCL